MPEICCPICSSERRTKHVKVFGSGIRVTRYRCAFCGTKYAESGAFWRQLPPPSVVIEITKPSTVRIMIVGEIS